MNDHCHSAIPQRGTYHGKVIVVLAHATRSCQNMKTLSCRTAIERLPAGACVRAACGQQGPGISSTLALETAAGLRDLGLASEKGGQETEMRGAGCNDTQTRAAHNPGAKRQTLTTGR